MLMRYVDLTIAHALTFSSFSTSVRVHHLLVARTLTQSNGPTYRSSRPLTIAYSRDA